jgi:predicted DNA-binding transcriptional regulator AlpA
MKPLLTEKAVSELTGLKLPTLRNHRHLCKGIPYIKVERTVRYDLADIEQYLRSHRISREG